jgi:hypothetical protein
MDNDETKDQTKIHEEEMTHWFVKILREAYLEAFPE